MFVFVYSKAPLHSSYTGYAGPVLLLAKPHNLPFCLFAKTTADWHTSIQPCAHTPVSEALVLRAKDGFVTAVVDALTLLVLLVLLVLLLSVTGCAGGLAGLL